MIDSHSHLDDPRFGSDLERQLEDASLAGIRGWVVPGIDLEGHPVRAALRERLQAAGYGGRVRFAVGVHPYRAEHSARKWNGRARLEQALADQARDLHAVAIGETGFDKSRPELAGALPDQELAFLASASVARQLGLPLILHVVRAEGEVLRAFKELGELGAGGVAHGFTGGPESAEQYLRRGLFLSFGPALLKRDPGSPLALAARRAPSERILVETDAPDQAGDLRTASQVLEVLARLRGAEPRELGAQVQKNAQSLFRCSFEP